MPIDALLNAFRMVCIYTKEDKRKEDNIFQHKQNKRVSYSAYKLYLKIKIIHLTIP